MKKLIILAILYSLAITIPTARGVDKGPEAVRAWFENLRNAKEKLTELHFFFHDTISGPNATALTVAEANITRTSPTSFGMVRMIDDPLTVGPEPDSKIIGRARGIYGSASFEDMDLLLTLNYVFTDGEYNGSSLSILAHNPVTEKYREMPVVGGTGIFRLARGIATAKTASLTSQVAVVEYNVMVLYYVNE